MRSASGYGSGRSEDGVHDGEDRGGRADAQGERDERDGGESRAPEEQPESQRDVTRQVVEGGAGHIGGILTKLFVKVIY